MNRQIFLLSILSLSMTTKTFDHRPCSRLSSESGNSTYRHQTVPSFQPRTGQGSGYRIGVKVGATTNRGKSFNGFPDALTVKLRNFQQQGDKVSIKNEIERFQTALLMVGRQRKIDMATSILNEPITDILSTIKNGTLKEAQAAIYRILTTSPYKYRFRVDHGSIYEITEIPELFSQKQAYYRDKYQCDVFEKAKQLYESRSYAPYISNCPLSIGCHPKSTTQSMLNASSILASSITDQQQLYDYITQQSEALQTRLGFVPDYYQSREQAFKELVSGNVNLSTQQYELSSQAQDMLKNHGVDPKQFTTCKGNVLQQDINAKLVNCLNTAAQKPATTRAAQQIKEGVLECAQAGTQLNQKGKLKEAMVMTDICRVAVEYLWDGINNGFQVAKGVVYGVRIGVSSELSAALQDPHASQEAVWTTGSWVEPDLRGRAAAETSIVVADLLRMVKGAGEVALSGIAGVGDAIVGLPELASNCVEVVQMTGKCLGHIGYETVMLLDAAERKDVVAFQQQADKMQQKCGQVAQGVSEFLAQIKAHKSCYNGQITKQDLKNFARSGGRIITEAMICSNVLKGTSKIMKGALTCVKSTESVCASLQQMKSVSGAKVRELILNAELITLSPAQQVPSLCATVECVATQATVIPEARVAAVFGTVEKQIAANVVMPQEAASASSLSQKIGQIFSFELKPGYIELPGIAGVGQLNNERTTKAPESNCNVKKSEKVNEIINEIISAERVGSALKKDAHHAFSDLIDNYAGEAKRFELIGADGQKRVLFQIDGSLEGVQGVFEWILEPENQLVTHRLFIKGGEITGKPNMWIKSV